ncbi:MAG: hypothetical protein N3J91_05915 [Verrucomicrobiae bacterium]|nr:hypothetical protein [Verrucomicrobiae bacterium]
MKFPQTITKGRGSNTQKVVIYGRTPAKQRYRIAYYRGGERIMESFSTYGEALDRAREVCEQLARHGRAPALSPKETEDARAALELLGDYCRQTGKPLSLTAAVRLFTDAARRLGSLALVEVVDKYREATASVHPVGLDKAVEEYLRLIESRTLPARPGDRPQLSPDYFRHVQKHLRLLAETLPGHQTTDLSQANLDAFFSRLASYSPKSRNHYRADLGKFLRWCISKDYLPRQTRLLESPILQMERAGVEDIEIYTPQEYQTLLAAAPQILRPVLALLGLAGLRDAELRRLRWEDVFGRPGYVEIGARIAKTRQRRLVPICPALAAWLAPCAHLAGPVWPNSENLLHKTMREVHAAAKVSRKRNGFRHSFISYRLALLGDTAKVALEAGNSPQIIFQHYRELVTREAAVCWFNIKPDAAENVVLLPGKVGGL